MLLRLDEMKIALMREQLRRGDVLESDRVMGSVDNNGVTGSVFMRRCKKSGYI